MRFTSMAAVLSGVLLIGCSTGKKSASNMSHKPIVVAPQKNNKASKLDAVDNNTLFIGMLNHKDKIPKKGLRPDMYKVYIVIDLNPNDATAKRRKDHRSFLASLRNKTDSSVLYHFAFKGANYKNLIVERGKGQGVFWSSKSVHFTTTNRVVVLGWLSSDIDTSSGERLIFTIKHGKVLFLKSVLVFDSLKTQPELNIYDESNKIYHCKVKSEKEEMLCRLQPNKYHLR